MLINDERVEMEVKYSMEPMPLSPYGPEDFGYQTVKNSIRQVWKSAVVAPGETKMTRIDWSIMCLLVI